MQKIFTAKKILGPPSDLKKFSSPVFAMKIMGQPHGI